jgi:hypothetical protein
MKKVILTALAGQIFAQSKNADGSPKLDKNGKPFGYVRVENPSDIDFSYAYNNGGVKRGQSALIAMTVEAWEKSKQFYKEGMEIKGNVVITESLTEGPGFKPKMAGSGENAQPCTLDGKQIYRKTEFDATCELADTLIAHNNVIVGTSVVAKAQGEALN